ncbi:DNA repair protein [Saprolegnia diclina VS20]|uniref:DNA repair protein n=1 Tax=Saprolegnia diclina (strain VS20) TaxID=1156394 RepID=T0QR21_SAPDV|nr:DNA repair protein [Saprolegnia diclina VS20]EQC37201.1 DNA repair protein [Saprolegnia diclina VS20]|eukprot:XP_008609363.1 DNA repair protein [Saprolegnia diclina VS20]
MDLPATPAACESCHLDLPCDQDFFTTFGLYVCRSCRYEGPAYVLLTKDSAKKRFLLPDSAFEDLPCLRRPNPKNERFAPLKLYLTKTCETACIELFGSLEKMLVEKEQRERKRFEKAVSRTKSVVASYGKQKASLSTLSGASAPKAKKAKPVEVAEHEHAYDTHEDQGDGLWVKACACGLRVTYHKL